MAALLPLEEAQARLISLAQRLPAETVSVANANNRYLAKDLLALRDQPAANMSAMDGYAIRFDDREGPWKLVGECKAGSPPCPPIKAGETARIFTGALLPEGSDAVVMQENVEAIGNEIKFVDEVSSIKSRHVRNKGGDLTKGSIALPAGSL